VFCDLNITTRENKVKISADDLYIVVTHISYDGISGDLDNLYTDKAEAEKDAAERSNMRAVGVNLKYTVMDLYDYIQEAKQDARDQGQMNERDRDRD
jgi:hypothetical protein